MSNSIEPTLDPVTGPFPQRVESTDPTTGLLSVRTYTDSRSFVEAREISKGTWAVGFWGSVPLETPAAYVRHIIEPTGVLHSNRHCGSKDISLTPISPAMCKRMLDAGARWCGKCASPEAVD